MRHYLCRRFAVERGGLLLNFPEEHKPDKVTSGDFSVSSSTGPMFVAHGRPRGGGDTAGEDSESGQGGDIHVVKIVPARKSQYKHGVIWSVRDQKWRAEIQNLPNRHPTVIYLPAQNLRLTTAGPVYSSSLLANT